jgi:ferrous iron transport protein A
MDSCGTWHQAAQAALAPGGLPRALASAVEGEPASVVSPRELVSLAQLRKGDRGHIGGIATDAGATVQIGDVAHSTIARRLMELGFVPGESVEVIRRVWPGGDPLAVRIGASVFALRRREAQAVMVIVDDSACEAR